MGRRPSDSPLSRMLAAGGIRRVEVAARSGCSVATIDRLALAKYDGLRIDTLKRVAVALGCAPAEIMPQLATRPAGGLLVERGVIRPPGK